MKEYKNIADSYGIRNCGYFRFLMLRYINECIDATTLVYDYIESQKKRSVLRFLYRRKLIRRYGIFIGENTRIGKGLKLPHPTSIIIGDGVVIEDNVTIFQNVTLGSKGIGANKYPKVKNKATIFAGAKIFGDITLGDSCTIGANSVINIEVEPNSVYAGVPARRLK